MGRQFRDACRRLMEARPRPFLADLHVHTIPLSLDSGLKPEVAIERARARGLNAICLTEHNACWGEAELRALSEKLEFPVFRGMEVGTDVGHVLVFGLGRFTPEMARVDLLRGIVEGEDGAMVLAHPMRSPGFARHWDDASGLFEALEALNADESAHTARVVTSTAHRLGLPTTGGSDAHTPVAVGRCATAFDAPILDERALVEALRAGACHGLNLQTHGHGHAHRSHHP